MLRTFKLLIDTFLIAILLTACGSTTETSTVPNEPINISDMALVHIAKSMWMRKLMSCIYS